MNALKKIVTTVTLVKDYLVLNRRRIVIISFGVIVAIVILLQGNIVAQSMEYAAVRDALKDSNIDDIRIKFQFPCYATDNFVNLTYVINDHLSGTKIPLKGYNITYPLTVKNKQGASVFLGIKEAEKNRSIIPIGWKLSLFFLGLPKPQLQNFLDYISLFNPTINSSELTQQLSQFPKVNETQKFLALYFPNYGNFSFDPNANNPFIFSSERTYSIISNGLQNFTLLNLVNIPRSSALESTIKKYIAEEQIGFSWLILVSSIENVFGFTSHFCGSENSTSGFSYTYSPMIQMQLDTQKITPNNLKQLEIIAKDEEQRLSAVLFNNLATYMDIKKLTTFEVNSTLNERFEILQLQLREYKFFSLLITIPIVILAVFLIFYTFGLVKYSTYKRLSILKLRGMTITQMLVLSVVEVLWISLMSTVISFIIAIPLSVLSLKSEGFFQLNFSKSNVELIIPTENLLLIVFASLAITFLANIPHFVKLLTLTEESPDITIEDVEPEPTWKKYNVDITLLVYSVSALLIYQAIQYTTQDVIPKEMVQFLAFSSIGMLLFSLPLLTARLFLVLLGNLSTFSWKYWGGLKSFALKNLKVRNQLAIRALAVIIMSITVSTIFISVPGIITNQLSIHEKYMTPADFVSSTINPNPNMTVIEDLKAKYPETVKGGSIAIEVVMKDPIFGYTIKLFAIDPQTYFNTIYLETLHGVSPSISHLKSVFSQNNNSITLWKESLAILRAKIGDTYNWSYFNEKDILKTLSLSIIGKFSLWPDAVEEDDYFSAKNGFNNEIIGIINLNTMAQILEKLALSSKISYLKITHYYIRLAKNNLDATQLQSLKQTFTEELHLNVISLQEQIQNTVQIDSPASIYSIVLLNTLILISGLVSLLTVLFFGITFIRERWQELGVERVLGLKKRDLILFMSLINVTIISYSFGTSLSIGILFTNFIGSFFFINIRNFPPQPTIVQVLPFNLLIGWYGALLLIMFVNVLLTIYYTIRRPIFNILTEEGR